MRSGFSAGFALGCGAVTVDVSYALLSSLSLGRLASSPVVRWPIAICGFLFLIYLGVQSLAAAFRHKREGIVVSEDSAVVGGAYRTGLFMTLLNPMTLAFWFIELPSGGAIMQDPGRELPMICAGVFIGTLAWVICFCGLLGLLGRWRTGGWLAVADAVGGAMLLILAGVGFGACGRIEREFSRPSLARDRMELS